MRKNVLFVGVDVDDKAFNVSVFNPVEASNDHFACKPNAKLLVDKLKKFAAKDTELRICYEACHIGFNLKRQVESHGLSCDVIAPGQTPLTPGLKRKTDRIDSQKLARFYANGLLTIVRVPDVKAESDRGLLRARRFLVEQYAALKLRMLMLCRIYGWDYAKESGKASFWTKNHRLWLDTKIKFCENSEQVMAIKILKSQLHQMESNIEIYDYEIEKLAKTERYKRLVEALRCFRGIETLSAMTLITEIFDIHRFSHPRHLMSYVGFDIREYSSGGKEKKFGITKSGNRYMRQILTESCQFALLKPGVSRFLQKRREGANPEYCAIADRCMARLHKKGNKMLHGGKSRNKVIVACAREMLGFIWEAMRKAEESAVIAA